MPHRAFVVHFVIGTVGLFLVIGLVLVGADLSWHQRSGSRLKRRLVAAGLLLLTALGADSAFAESARSRSFKRIANITADAEQVASGKRGSHPFDHAGKQRLLDRLNSAIKEVTALNRSGAVSDGEAGLWKQDLQALQDRVRRYRTTELKNATCYKPMRMPIPARVSARRLQLRLPFLEKMAGARRKLNRTVTRKVLQQIERDLAVLKRRENLAAIKDQTERKRTRRLARQVSRHLRRVRAKLGPSKRIE